MSESGLTKEQLDIVQRINLFIMSYLDFPEATKHWKEGGNPDGSWTEQEIEIWQRCIMRITKDLTAIELGISTLPTYAEFQKMFLSYMQKKSERVKLA